MVIHKDVGVRVKTYVGTGQSTGGFVNIETEYGDNAKIIGILVGKSTGADSAGVAIRLSGTNAPILNIATDGATAGQKYELWFDQHASGILDVSNLPFPMSSVASDVREGTIPFPLVSKMRNDRDGTVTNLQMNVAISGATGYVGVFYTLDPAGN